MTFRILRVSWVLVTGLLVLGTAHSALFEDDEARKAILDLRQRVEALRVDVEKNGKTTQANKDESSALTNGMLDLHRQMELLRAELANLRGANEKLSKELADLQRSLKDDAQSRTELNERLAQLEPSKVTVDGAEFMVEPSEKRSYEAALAVFRRGDFAGAQNQFVGFLSRYPASGYALSALFWLGNAQYATRDYKEAITNFRTLIARNPEHLRAPEAVLSVANCQLELKDAKGARKTLTDLIKAYPQSEAAVAAKERLASLK